jgi:hypothetical protein
LPKEQPKTMDPHILLLFDNVEKIMEGSPKEKGAFG